MAEQDFIVYWTDGLNPPRRLVLTGQAGAVDLPFPSIQTLFEQEQEDPEAYDIYQFSSSFSYTSGTSYMLASPSTVGLFADLPVGTDVVLGPISVHFRKKGIRNHVAYNVLAGIESKGVTLESVDENFHYALCNTGGFRIHGALSFLHTTQAYFVRSLQFTDRVRILCGRPPGGGIIYFPCVWRGGNGPSYRYVRISGTVAIQRDVPFTVNPQYATSMTKVWPARGGRGDLPQSIVSEGPYADPPAPPVVEGITASQNASGASQTSAAIALPAGITAGNLLIIAVAGDSLHPGSINGWEPVRQAWTRDSAKGRARGDLRTTIELYKRVADGSEGASVTINWENPQSWVAWAIRISGNHTGEVFFNSNALTTVNNRILCSAVPSMLPGSPLFQVAAVNDYDSAIQWSSRAGFVETQRIVLGSPNILTAGLAQATQPEAVRQADGTYTLTTIAPDVTFPGAPESEPNAMAALAFGVKSNW